MIQLNQLPKITAGKKRGLGRGQGSGRGKTAGRGTKGQKARAKIPLGFEGGQLALIKRLPLYRGKGRNKSFAQKPLIVNLKVLGLLPKDTVVTKETLVKHGILRAQDVISRKVKILGDGQLKQTLTVWLPTSAPAAKKIIAAGGKVELKK